MRPLFPAKLWDSVASLLLGTPTLRLHSQRLTELQQDPVRTPSPARAASCAATLPRPLPCCLQLLHLAAFLHCTAVAFRAVTTRMQLSQGTLSFQAAWLQQGLQ